ncbi:MAG TPA: MBL fold metallo-hydrolase [Thermoleophilaceae bacterium]
MSAASITLVRHATLIIEIGGRRLLLDPMLDTPGARPPIDNSPRPRANPLVPLPMPAPRVVRGIDAAAITHLHADHFDGTARELLPPGTTVLCQPEDAPRLVNLGDWELIPVGAELEWEDVRVIRTGGVHGFGELGENLGPVSGFVFVSGRRRIYVAGDTVWCPPVAEALERYQPTAIVLNAGAARFLEGDTITMDAGDVATVARAAPDAFVMAVHMEAINHCLLTREELREALWQENLTVAIPADGETIALA